MFTVSYSSPLALAEEFKVVGYLPDYDYQNISQDLDLAIFSDINYFSLIPTKEGKLTFTANGNEADLHELVQKAHEKKVKVGVSIGGWGLSENFKSATSEDYRTEFISSIVSFSEKYNIDTVDIDWEYPAEEQAEKFAIFLKELKEQLPNQQLSVSVPSGVSSSNQVVTNWEHYFTSKALNEADWVNIMAYNAQDVLEPHHSPVSLQEDSLNYWNNLMGGQAMHKLVAGIPFYGKSHSGKVLTYHQLSYLNKDKLADDTYKEGEEVFYYNGSKSVKSKVKTSLQLKSKGVMIWSPTYDGGEPDTERLMDTINETIQVYQKELENAQLSKKGKSTWKNRLLSTSNLTIKGSLCLFIFSFIGRNFYNSRWYQLMPKKIGKYAVDRRVFIRRFSFIFLFTTVWLMYYLKSPMYINISLLSIFFIQKKDK